MSLKERIELAKEQLGISEVDTQALEKALGKKLVDYESTEALVAALMGYYNEELKKKANTSHTHDYAPSSHKHKKADISDFPTSMKNPYALSIQLNSGTAYTYDGAATKNINITPASIGAADSSHTHTKANITDFPTSMKNPNALEIKMNGQNPVSYDGAAAKSINITASGIGAEPAFKKNGAFNKNFGTTSNTVLEGAKLAEILGLTYGGSLNTSSAKTVNYAYYDSTTKKVYKCIKATSINYADANYFEAISNNDLLGKLQNLHGISFPNYLKLKKVNSKTYTAEFACEVKPLFYISRGTAIIKINNIEVGAIYHDYGGRVPTSYFLRKNDVITVDANIDNIFYVTPLL